MPISLPWKTENHIFIFTRSFLCFNVFIYNLFINTGILLVSRVHHCVRNTLTWLCCWSVLDDVTVCEE